jgi:hypothetical protein
MIGVAATGCALGLLLGLGRRSVAFERLAVFHHRAAAILAEEGGSGCMDVPGADEGLFEPKLRRAYLYHHDLGRRYSRAARRPWLSVSSGPPPAWAYPNVLTEVLQARAIPH